MESHVPSNDLCGFWTNEKHVSFLKRMEASFVRTMLENRCRRSTSMLTYAHAPLDRYLPDISESTRDLVHRRNRRKITHLYFTEDTDSNTIVNRAAEWKKRRRSSKRHDVSEDKVVPQLAHTKSEEDDDLCKL